MKKTIFLFFVFSIFSLTAYAQLVIVQKGGKHGLKFYDSNKWELKPKYDSIIEVSDDCFILKKKELYGMFHEKYLFNYELIKPKYKQLIGPLNQEFCFIDNNGRYALFDHKGDQLTKFEFKQILLMKRYRLFQTFNDKWMFEYKSNTSHYGRDTVFADSISVDGQHTILFSGRNTKIGYELFTEKTNELKVYGHFDDSSEMAIINENGQVKTGISFDRDIGRKVIILKAKYGNAIADEKGRIASPWYKNITTLSNGQYMTTDGFKYGIIGKDLQEIFKPRFSELRQEADGYITRRDETYHGLFNLTSRKETIYEIYGQNGELLAHSDIQIKKVSPGKYKVGDKLFNVTHNKFEEGVVGITDAGCGFHQIRKDTSYYYVDTSGKKISEEFPVMYEKKYRDDGLTALFGVFKLITIMPFVTEIASGENPFVGRGYKEKKYGSGFHENRAVVAIPDKKGKAVFGYIDTSLQLVIPYQYDEATVFYGEIAFVKKKEKWAIIDKENKNLSGFIYDEIQPFGYNLIIVKRGTKKYPFSFINYKAEKVDLPEFSSYTYESDGTITIEIGNFSGKKFTVTQKGEMLPYKQGE